MAEHDPQDPQEVHTGHPALLQFTVSEEAPEQLVEEIGFPSKIHCLDLDRIESLPHVFEHPDQSVHLLQVGQAGRVHTFTSVLCPTHLSLGCTVYFKTQTLFLDWCEVPQLAEQPPHGDQSVQIALHSLHRSF